jgi:hypothetical protein
VILEQVASLREGWSSCPLSNQSNLNFCLPGVCGNGRKNSESEILKFPIWLFTILDKYSRNIFGRPRCGVLLKFYFNLEMSYE